MREVGFAGERVTARYVVSAILLGLLLVAPLGSAQAGDRVPQDQAVVVEEILKTPGKMVTFYGHQFHHDQANPMPMNTQFPKGESDYSIGVASGCGAPPPLPTNALAKPSCETWASNNQLWYTTAGFVQVKTSEEFTAVGYSAFHNERGMTKDVYVDMSMKPVSTFHMSADFHGWLVALCAAACWNWDPGYFQDWVVESWLWHAPLGEWGSDPSGEPDMSKVVQRAPEAVLLAHGKTAPIDMMSLDPSVPTGEKTVYAFTAEMEWDPAFAATNGRIPYTSNIVAEFRWYQETDGQKYILGVATAAPNWNVNSGEDWPSNVVVPVRNAIDVELVYPQFIHDKLVVLSVINTPWGSYDIDPGIINITFTDAKGSVIVPEEGTMFRVLEQSVAHAGHYLPVKPTWVWDFKKHGLEPGEYTVTVEVTNFQHSVTTSTSAKFTVTAEGGGTTEEGRSGFQTLKGNLHAGHEGTAADPNAQGNTTTGADPPADKDSPGWAAAPAVVAVAAAAFLVRRRSR
jgi:hypothetical protein